MSTEPNHDSIHPDTRLGPVHLTVSDLARSIAFYEQLGFKLHRRENNTAWLGAGRGDLLVLVEDSAAERPRGTTGLYHFAVLVPSRRELAQVLMRISKRSIPVHGFADHLVSEAIYLPDPDGIGIEIYRDLPREQWQTEDDGTLKMATEHLDLDGVLSALEGDRDEVSDGWVGLHEETVIGHVHLHVPYLDEIEVFYQQVLGFDLVLRYGTAATFLSAGGYHHHIGCNTWAGEGAPPPPPGSIGLRWYTVCLPGEAELERVVERLRGAGVDLVAQDGGLLLRDPAGNGVLLVVG